jgi:hypothetical protein
VLTDDEKNMLQALKDLWCGKSGHQGVFSSMTLEEYVNRSWLARDALRDLRNGDMGRLQRVFRTVRHLRMGGIS